MTKRNQKRLIAGVTLAGAGVAFLGTRRLSRNVLASGLRGARRETDAIRKLGWRNPLKSRAAREFHHQLNSAVRNARGGLRRPRKLEGQLLGPARRLRRTLRGRW